MNAREKRTLAWTVAAALVTTLVVSIFTRESGPDYQGRSVADWMVRLESGNDREAAEANDAFQALGTNALPTIIRCLGRTDSAWKWQCMRQIARLRLLDIRWNNASFERRRAKAAFITLGYRNWPPSLPSLIQLSKHANADVRRTAIELLALVVFVMPEALPELESAQNDADTQVQLAARTAVRDYQKSTGATTGRPKNQ